ncbi:MAG: CBS domain-containing protein [Candidatus Bathyarchaeia archaeon]
MPVEVPEKDTLGHVMSSPVTTIDSDSTLDVAAQLMVQHDIGSVIVVEAKNPIGIVTERDITKQVIKGKDVLKKPIKQVMSKPLVTATPNMSIQDALELMLKNKVRRLPILEGKDMRGIVTTRDLMRWVLRVSYEPNVPRHIKAILEIR